MNLGTLKQARWLLVSAVNFKGSRLTLGDGLLGMPVGINLFRVIEVGRPTYRGWHYSLGLGLELYGKGENLLNITITVSCLVLSLVSSLTLLLPRLLS